MPAGAFSVAFRNDNASDPGQSNRRRGPCAVCIDDDSDFMSILTRGLKDLGVSVIATTNAINGVRAIVRERPDMVLTDYYMPNAFGTYVLRHLQQDSSANQVPVIVITGCELSARIDASRRMTLKQQLQRLGATSILRKPLNREALTRAVTLCLETSRLRFQADAAPGDKEPGEECQ